MTPLDPRDFKLYPGATCKDCQPLGMVRDRFWARRLLEQYKNDTFAMTAMRDVLARHATVWLLTKMSTNDVIDHMARLLGQGFWHVHRFANRSSEATQQILYVEPASAANNQPTGSSSPSGTGGSPAPQYQGPAVMVHIADFGTRDTPRPVLEGEDLHWVEIKLIGEDGKPISGEKYKIVLPDGAIVEGALDGEGLARVDDIPQAGQCMISFPELDREAWDPV